MASPRRRPLVAAALLALALVTLPGCSGDGAAIITHYPKWDFERYQRLGVLPTRVNDPRAAPAGQTVTRRLEELLAQSEAFTVLSRSDLNSVLDEQDLSRLADVSDPATVIPAGQIAAAQALVVARIDPFDVREERRQVRQPVYQTDARGRIFRDRAGRPIIVGERVTDIFRHVASIGGTVRVIDTTTGAVIHTYQAPLIEKEDESRGAPPELSAVALATAAAEELARDFVNQLAPFRAEVELDSDMLVVALDWYDGRYDETSSVPDSLEQVLVAVRNLPPPCDRNEFRLTVVPENGRQEVFTQTFVWSAGSSARGLQFPIALEALRSSGARSFEVKLYSGRDEAPVLTRSFKLKESRPAARSDQPLERTVHAVRAVK